MPRARRFAAITLVTLTATLAVAACLSWRSPPFYDLAALAPLPAPLLTDAQYDAVHETFPRPFVVQCDAGTGALLVYGSAHTKDPADPQIADLVTRFAAFRPTVVLVEGRPGAPLAALRDPVRQFGEGGIVLREARRANVPVWTWEPSRAAEVRAQLTTFPAERVALFYVLRPYVSSRRFGRPSDPDAVVEDTRAERTRWPGLEGTLPSVAAIDSMWQRDFAGLPDWRDTSDERGWPGYLGEIFAASNRLRDEHVARVILEQVDRSERVFAVAGSSHAVRLEPPLRAACVQAPRTSP